MSKYNIKEAVQFDKMRNELTEMRIAIDNALPCDLYELPDEDRRVICNAYAALQSAETQLEYFITE